MGVWEGLHSLYTQHKHTSQDINTCGHRHSHPVPHKPHTPILTLVQTPAAHSATRTRPRGPCHTRTLSLSFSLSISLSHTHTGSTLAAHSQTHRHALANTPLSNRVPLLEHCSARLHACRESDRLPAQHTEQPHVSKAAPRHAGMQEKQGDARDT